MSAVLACDLGGTSFRAALIDAEGATHAEQAIIGPVTTNELGHAEIPPNHCWEVLAEAAALAQTAPVLFQQTQAIALCGVTRTQIFLDGAGRHVAALADRVA